MPARPRTTLLVLVILALLAAACGNSDDSDDAEAVEAPTTTESAGTEQSPTPTSEASDEDKVDTPQDSDSEPAEPEQPDRHEFVPLDDVPGVSDEEIRFAVVGTKANNPLGTNILDAYSEGVQAYFDWRNSEGGIFGRELVVDRIVDDELALNLQRATELVAADDVFGNFQATLIASGWPLLEENRIPTWVWGIHATDAADKEFVWGHIGVGCPQCVFRQLPYIQTLSGATKIGVIGYGASENSKQATAGFRNSFETFAEETGAEIVYFNDNLDFGLPNGLAVEVSEMKDAGVELIAPTIDLNGMKTLAQELERQGIRDEVVLYHPNTYDHAFVAEADPLFEGDYIGISGFVPFEADVDIEQLERFHEFMAAQGAVPTQLSMTGWLNANLAFEGLLAAGPEFDRQKVTDATNAMTEYDAGGLGELIDWTRQKQPPTPDDPVTHGPAIECYSVVRVIDGGFETVADPSTPWMCWDRQDPSLSEPMWLARTTDGLTR